MMKRTRLMISKILLLRFKSFKKRINNKDQLILSQFLRKRGLRPTQWRLSWLPRNKVSLMLSNRKLTLLLSLMQRNNRLFRRSNYRNMHQSPKKRRKKPLVTLVAWELSLKFSYLEHLKTCVVRNQSHI